MLSTSTFDNLRQAASLVQSALADVGDPLRKQLNTTIGLLQRCIDDCSGDWFAIEGRLRVARGILSGAIEGSAAKAADGSLADELRGKSPAEVVDFAVLVTRLLDQANEVLYLIPECPVHGANCLPHYRDWIKSRIATESDNPIVAEANKSA